MHDVHVEQILACELERHAEVLRHVFVLKIFSSDAAGEDQRQLAEREMTVAVSDVVGECVH